ncbi:MAG: transcriptional regulator BetI [Roseobacter sp.]
MPKVGMEPLRRASLIEATISEIGTRGSLDVTVSQIAKRAGMSSALAHHYFGGKDQIFNAAMRQILRDFGSEVRARLICAKSPRARIEAIVEASFAASCFAPSTISAWMALYASAQVNRETEKLLRLYQRRLHSNLVHDLRCVSETPEKHASTIAALIDGFYLRAALAGLAPEAARIAVLDAVDTMLGSAP